jgi:hypothetical protein
MSGGGKGGGETVQMPKFQKEAAKWGLGQARDLYNQGGPDYFPGQTWLPFSGQTQNALSLMEQRALSGSPVEQSMQDYIMQSLGTNQFSPGIQGLTNTASGAFLNSNPYLDQMFGQAASNVSDQWKNTVLPGLNASFAGAGGENSAVQQQIAMDSAGELGDILSGLATNIYGGNYAAERGFMENAAGQLGDLYGQGQRLGAALAPQAAGLDWSNLGQLANVGQTYEGKEYEKLEGDMDRWNYQQQQPYNNLDWYMRNVMGNGMMGQNTSSQSGSQLAGAIGGGLAGAGLASQIWNTPFAGTPWGWGLVGLGALTGLL